MKVSTGDRVRVLPNHWLRPGQYGKVVGFEAKRISNRWLIAFDKAFVGGGIQGKKLYLSEDQFEVLKSRRSDGRI